MERFKVTNHIWFKMDYTVTLQPNCQTLVESWTQQEDVQPHTKGFNFTIKISVETWHARRVGENKDPTKWQSCPSDTVIETCQNKCAWWSIITRLEERAFQSACVRHQKDKDKAFAVTAALLLVGIWRERISSYYLCIKKVRIIHFEYI